MDVQVIKRAAPGLSPGHGRLERRDDVLIKCLDPQAGISEIRPEPGTIAPHGTGRLLLVVSIQEVRRLVGDRDNVSVGHLWLRGQALRTGHHYKISGLAR